ncbi:MAG: glycosyltransferase family 2 protein [Candidatus Omnitrophica bacterium]|nr:glycosyltransferase family 2 protein [Candidatus Omnitrophota bacterium]
MQKELSVIVCTRNRSFHLKEALDSLVNQSVGTSLNWEIIVIDNASEDDTDLVVGRAMKSTGIDMRYILETKIGLSNARNRGLCESIGDIVAFIDDDAIADEKWLEEIMSVYNCENVISAGGKTVALWEISHQKRVDEELFFFAMGYGPQQKDVRTLNGSNMSFRRNVLMGIGGFDANLGRKDKCRLSGDDNDMFDSIHNKMRRSRIIYNPRAIVYHKVLPDRLTREELIKKHYCTGIGLAVVDRKQQLPCLIYRLLRRIKKITLLVVILIIRLMSGKDVMYSDLFYKLQGHKGYFKKLIFGSKVACNKCPIFRNTTYFG